MRDAKKPVNPVEAPKRPAEPTQPQTGGFGAFSEVYRARWAKNHPNMRRRDPEPTDLAPDPSPPPSTESHPAEKRSRLPRPEELS